MSEVDQAREKLLEGVRSFGAHVFPEKKNAYEKLMREGQSPHTLFITCADSRIDPATLTQCEPGELFVARNIGNIVPAYGESSGGISAVIEYAAEALEVKQVVICGHSGCGAMKGLLNPGQVAGLPTVKSWLRNAEAALSVTRALHENNSDESAMNFLIEQNVLLQLNHLRTHPSIAGRLASGRIGLAGWVYQIAQGTVSMYNENSTQFELISPSASQSLCRTEVLY